MTSTVETQAEKVADTVTDNVTSPTTEEKEKVGEGEKSPAKKALAPTVHKTDYEEDVVYLYQFSRCPTIASASPFCLKVETYLRMAELKYENVDHKLKYKSKAGLLPFVELNGKEINDSELIIKELSEKFGKNLDDGLSAEQKITSHAFVSMLDNHTSWVQRWWRYNNARKFLEIAQIDVKQAVNSVLPKPLIQFLFILGFRNHAKQAVGHGLGRHTAEQILNFGREDLKSLSQFLGDKKFFFGNEPHLLDCVAFAHISQFYYVPFEKFDEWLKTETPNLVAHLERMKEKYWPDWDRICKTLELNTHLYEEGQEPPMSDAEKKALEEKKAKEEAKKQKEELKKQKAEQKKKEKEEREKKKAEEAEKKRLEKEEAEKKKAEEAAKKAEEAKAKETEEAAAKPAETTDKPAEEKKE